MSSYVSRVLSGFVLVLLGASACQVPTSKEQATSSGEPAAGAAEVSKVDAAIADSAVVEAAQSGASFQPRTAAQQAAEETFRQV